MIDQSDIQKIKETTLKFFQVATIDPIRIEVTQDLEAINISLILNDPQILIGEKGQTLLETQRLLKIILNKKLQKVFYVNLDINDYKKKKFLYRCHLTKEGLFTQNCQKEVMSQQKAPVRVLKDT